MKTHTFKRLLRYLKGHRLRLFFVLLFASVSTIFTVMAPFVIGKVTTTLFDSIRDGVFYWETILWLLAALVCLYLDFPVLFVFAGLSYGEDHCQCHARNPKRH